MGGIRKSESGIVEFNVFQLLKDPIGSTRRFEVDDEITTDDGSEYKITGSAELLRTNRGVLVRASLSTIAQCTCSRCLKPFSCPVPISFEEEFFPTINIADGSRLDSTEEPGSFRIDSRHILSLEDAIREYLVINMPMKPLCREDCAGLCSVCGQNLNEGSCQCDRNRIDSRWTPLLSLKRSRKGLNRSMNDTST